MTGNPSGPMNLAENPLPRSHAHGRRQARLTPSAKHILDALRLLGAPAGTGQLAELAGVTRMTATRALSALSDEGLVEWQGTSKRDPRAVWALT